MNKTHVSTVADLIAALQNFPPDMLVMTTERPGETEVLPMQYGPADGDEPHAVPDKHGWMINCVYIRGADGTWDDEDDSDEDSDGFPCPMSSS